MNASSLKFFRGRGLAPALSNWNYIYLSYCFQSCSHFPYVTEFFIIYNLLDIRYFSMDSRVLCCCPIRGCTDGRKAGCQVSVFSGQEELAVLDPDFAGSGIK